MSDKSALKMLLKSSDAVRAEDERQFAVKRAVRLYVAEHPGCSRAELQRELGISDTDFWMLVKCEGVRFVRGGRVGYWPTDKP